jgi:uncharacterized protein
MKVSLTYSPSPRLVREWLIDLPSGSSAASALEISGLFEAFPQLRKTSLALGIWGEPIDANCTLQPHDRLEVYRRLLVDPKVARRERFKRQGSKGTGLFSDVRAGGKAGY